MIIWCADLMCELIEGLADILEQQVGTMRLLLHVSPAMAHSRLTPAQGARAH